MKYLFMSIAIPLCLREQLVAMFKKLQNTTSVADLLSGRRCRPHVALRRAYFCHYCAAFLITEWLIASHGGSLRVFEPLSAHSITIKLVLPFNYFLFSELHLITA